MACTLRNFLIFIWKTETGHWKSIIDQFAGTQNAIRIIAHER